VILSFVYHEKSHPLDSGRVHLFWGTLEQSFASAVGRRTACPMGDGRYGVGSQSGGVQRG